MKSLRGLKNFVNSIPEKDLDNDAIVKVDNSFYGVVGLEIVDGYPVVVVELYNKENEDD